MAARDYAGAFALFQRCARIAPNDDRCPYNGGIAAYLEGKLDVAAEQWKRAKVLDANNWRVHAKLIQAYQGIGDLRARDAERAELFAQWSRAAEGDELRNLNDYCRDQWTFGAYRVMGIESFKTDGKGPILHYRFIIGKDGGEEGSEWLALVSFPGKDGRGYGLINFAGPAANPVVLAHYAAWDVAPTYDELRKLVIAILQGNQKPLRGDPLHLP